MNDEKEALEKEQTTEAEKEMMNTDKNQEVITEENQVKTEEMIEETSEEQQTQSVDKNEAAFSKEEENLQAQIKELEGKLEEMENRYLRLQADFENYRRRAKLDFEAAQKYRSQSLISDLLPVIDNFERALQVEADNDHTKSVLKGMEMVYKGLIEALKKEGAEPIEAVGKEFDPYFHQAVMQVSEEGYDSNIVIEEFQKGYKLKDRVIRPSMVKVNQ